jgi:phage/plasmid-like protein (TIGR03299 family)
MSQETAEWLNTLVLVGFTDKRGNAWHHDAALQNGRPNHYPLAIPVGDVVERLFNFEVQSKPLYVYNGNLEGSGVPLFAEGFAQVPDRQAMVAGAGAPFPGDVFGIFKDGYQGHAYREWLLENAERIMGDTLAIGSAGLLRKGAQAWVQYELEESRNVLGVDFRPYLLAYTSYDGSLATGYKLGAKVAVCDNTFEIARSDKDGNSFKLKHTRNSGGKVLEAREALGVLFAQGDAMEQEITRLIETEVTRTQFNALVDRMVPLPSKDGTGKVPEGRSLTIAINKRDALQGLYANDNRVAPWAGTAWGALQAFNTFGHHVATVKGTSRSQRIRSNAIDGTQAKADALVLEALEEVLVTV